MATLTVHDIGLIKVWVCLVDSGSTTILPNVVIQVPALVLIEHSEHGMLLLVCFQLEKQNKTSAHFEISDKYSPIWNIQI